MKRLDVPLVPAGAAVGRVLAWRGGRASTNDDCLVEEVPVALVLNGVSHAVMLVTPVDLEDFALGFGLSEGLLAHAGELYGVEVVPGPQGLRVEMEVASACFARLKERRRSLAGRTGCGLCGTESLEQVRLPLPPLAGGGPRVEPPAVAQALAQLRQAQALQQSTGAVHAAAWCSLSGEARIVREDVGRHNALDKTLGAMVRGGVEPAQGLVSRGHQPGEFRDGAEGRDGTCPPAGRRVGAYRAGGADRPAGRADAAGLCAGPRLRGLQPP